MRHNIYLAQRFVRGLSYEQFSEDELYFYAVTRCLEIISEASRRVPEEIKARHPESHGLRWRRRETSIAMSTRTLRSGASGALSKRAFPVCLSPSSRN